MKMSGVVLLFAFTAFALWLGSKVRRAQDTPTITPSEPRQCEHRETMPIGRWVWECRCGALIEKEPK